MSEALRQGGAGALGVAQPPGPKPAAFADLSSLVVAWQRVHGRHGLPWQGTRDPYRVWLSEVMLQQTQVSTVLGYFDRFLQRFPDVQALAAAPLDQVLSLWSGLGYYSRARNLHRCAQAVMALHGGQFPGSSQALAGLPGIGPSTAAAMAAFCFAERAAILDGNVKRVLTRALGFEGDLAQPAQERRLWDLARQLLPDAGVEAYTQGL
ncbi:MAG: A/G-specific adenine glycosylase, partial [Rubrivivax sp.]